MRKASTTAVAMVLFGAACVACGPSGPRLRQPVGHTRTTSASTPPRTETETAPGYVPPAVELYVARQQPGPCGMDRVPPVDFEFGSSTIDDSRDVELQRLADCLKQQPFDGAQILLVGHADPVGSATFNLDLAYARAEHVMARLVQLGVQPSRIVVSSAGEAMLPHDRWDEARRVDIVLARPGAASLPPPGSAPAPAPAVPAPPAP